MKKKIYGFRKGFITLFALVGMAQLTSAQVGVGTNSPDPSAQLQIESENKGLLIPRVTNVSVVTNPATGLMVYQTGDTAGFYYNKGTALVPEWKRVADAGSSAGVEDGTVTNAKVAAGAGIEYSKLNLAGSITGSDIGMSTIQGSNIAPMAIGSAQLAPMSVSGINIMPGSIMGSSIMPGSIMGSHLMPSTIMGMHIMPGTITGTNIGPSTITGMNIMPNTITGLNIMAGTVDPNKLNANNAIDGQVLGYSNATGVGWVTPSSGGSSSGFTRSYGVARNTSSSVVAVVLGGTDVPLPDNQYLKGFTVDGTNSAFTIIEGGVYRVSYTIDLQAAMLVSSQVLLNGVPRAGSMYTPSVATNHLSSTFLFGASAGTTVTLQLFGLIGAVTLNNNCMISIERIDDEQP